jgi:hypothetical protein
MQKYTATITYLATPVTVEAFSPLHAFRDLRGYGRDAIKCLHEGTTLETPNLLPEVLQQLARSAQLDREAARRPARWAEQRAYSLLNEEYPLD